MACTLYIVKLILNCVMYIKVYSDIGGVFELLFRVYQLLIYFFIIIKFYAFMILCLLVTYWTSSSKKLNKQWCTFRKYTCTWLWVMRKTAIV